MKRCTWVSCHRPFFIGKEKGFFHVDVVMWGHVRCYEKFSLTYESLIRLGLILGENALGSCEFA